MSKPTVVVAFIAVVLFMSWPAFTRNLSLPSSGFSYISSTGTIEGDLDMADYDIKNPDVVYQEAAASDVVADDVIVKGANAYSQAATNTTGAALNLSGGVGTKKITCLFATAGGTTLTFVVDNTSTTITEGVDWNKDTDDNGTAAALETYLDANISGFTATAVANVVWLNPTYTTQTIDLSSANGAGGGTAFVVVDGSQGTVAVQGNIQLHNGALYLEDGGNAMINSSGSDIRFGTAGANLRMAIETSRVKTYVNIVAGLGVTVEGKFVISPETLTVADSGDGNPATTTFTPTKSYVEITCNDAHTCDITMGETGPPSDGTHVTFVNTSANTADFADTGGVSELAGAYAMTQWQTLKLVYEGTTWVEVGRSAN